MPFSSRAPDEIVRWREIGGDTVRGELSKDVWWRTKEQSLENIRSSNYANWEMYTPSSNKAATPQFRNSQPS
jgi:hypothetical protein